MTDFMGRPKGGIPWNKGLKGKQVAWNKGKKLSEKHIANLRLSHLGNVSPNKGKTGKRKYGCDWSSPSAYQQRLEKIAGRRKPSSCELCGKNGKIVFDHCHKTGKFRGWICYKCNNALGSVNDNIYVLTLMIEYLKRNFSS